MSNSEQITSKEQEISPNLTLWLISSAAQIGSALSRDAVLAETRAALTNIGLDVVDVWAEGDEPAPDSRSTILIRAPDGLLCAAIHNRDAHLDAGKLTAVTELLSCVEPVLQRFPRLSASGERGDIPQNLARIEDTLATGTDRASIVSQLLDIVIEQFKPEAAAIVSTQPLSILDSRTTSAAGNSASNNVVLRHLAAKMLDSVPALDSRLLTATCEHEHLGSVESFGVLISRSDNESLLLVLAYRAESEEAQALDQSSLMALGQTVRSSRHAQDILSGPAYELGFLTALNEATLAAASTHDLRQLYEAIRHALAQVMPTDAMIIAIIPPGAEEGVTVYRAERNEAYFNLAPLSAPFQTAMKLGRPFIVDEIPNHLKSPGYRFGDDQRRVQSLAGAPLISNDRVTGLIVTQSYEPSAFHAEHADLLLDIGRSIAVALERAQLVDRLQTRSTREAAMRNLTQRLTTTLDIGAMLDAIVTEVSAVLEDTLVAAVSVDTGIIPPLRQVAVTGPESLRQALGIGPDGTIRDDGLAGSAIDAGADVNEVLGNLTWTVMPLQDDGDPIGTLIIARQSLVPFDDDERSAFAILEGIMVSALRNARLYRDRARDESDLLEVERISRLVASSLDTSSILKEILGLLPGLFQSEGCSVRMVEGSDLVPLAVHGEIVHTFADRIPIDTSLAGSIVRDKRLLAVDDLHTHPATGRHARRTGVKVRGWLAAPMIDADGDVFGILSIHSDFPRRWKQRDKVLLQTLAESTSVAILNAWRFSRTRDILLASVESLANAVDAKDPTTLNHSRNVSMYARALAVALGLAQQDVDSVALAGLLHDIGKIGIPDRILQKPDVLTGTEWDQMKMHPVIGEQILSGNVHLAPVLSLVRHHHERWDGMGYPDRLQGNAIPLGAAIVALADAVDTMASERPYRSARPWTYVCEIVRTQSGKQFHPAVAETFLALAEAGEIERITGPAELQPAQQFDAHMHHHSLDARALMIFHGVAREVRALTDIETFLANVTLVIREVMELSDIQIFLVDEQTGEIVYRPSEHDRLRGFTDARRAIGTGVVGWVVEHGESLLVPDVTQDDRFISASVNNVRSELAVPLIVDEQVIGAINVESSIASAFTDADERLLTATAAHLAQSIQVARLHDRFKQLASTDSLTGLANHRAFYERLEEEIRHAAATDGVLTVAIMDIDNLKVVNDTLGHLAGDTMLREIATVLQERCRRSDQVARYGGDEFAFILADTDLAGAEMAISHLRAGLAERTVVLDGRSNPLPTGAWGMATYPEDGVRPAELVRVADRRMYTHKRVSKVTRYVSGSAETAPLVLKHESGLAAMSIERDDT